MTSSSKTRPVPAETSGSPAPATTVSQESSGHAASRESAVTAEVEAYAHYLRTHTALSATTVVNSIITVRAFMIRHSVLTAEVTDATVSAFLDEVPKALTRKEYACRIRRWLAWAVAEQRLADTPVLASLGKQWDIPADLMALIDRYTTYLQTTGGHAAITASGHRWYVRGITDHYQLPGQDLTDQMITTYVEQQTLASYRHRKAGGVIRRWRAWCETVNGAGEQSP